MFKYIAIILAGIFMNGMPGDAFAQTGSGTSAPYNALYTVLSQPGVELHPGMTKTEFKICQIRRIFCGKMAVVTVAFAIFLMGIMLMDNKLSWPLLLIIIVGIVVFVSADKLARTFGKSTFVLFLPNPLCNCNCKVEDLAACIE